MEKLKIGKVYTIKHSRKGTFTARIVSEDSDSCRVKIVGGVVFWVEGEILDVRKSLATFTLIDK